MRAVIQLIKKWLNIDTKMCTAHNWKPMHIYYSMTTGERGVDSYCNRCGEWLHTNSKYGSEEKA